MNFVFGVSIISMISYRNWNDSIFTCGRSQSRVMIIQNFHIFYTAQKGKVTNLEICILRFSEINRKIGAFLIFQRPECENWEFNAGGKCNSRSLVFTCWGGRGCEKHEPGRDLSSKLHFLENNVTVTEILLSRLLW